MKAILLLGIFLTMPIISMHQQCSSSSSSSESSRLVKRDPLGRIPFHYVALLPEEIPSLPKQDYNIHELDAIKARMAAFVAREANTSLDVKDNQGKTPYYYAEMNKEKLPTVYKVMQAIKLVHDINKKIALMNQMTDEYLAEQMMGDDKSNRELKSQLDSMPKLSEEEFQAWFDAEKTIEEYAKQVRPQ